MFTFITFRNHRQKILYCFTSASVADSENHIKKVNRNLECQQNYNIPRPVCETSIKKEKLWKRPKSTKCYVNFHNYPQTIFLLFHIYKCCRFRKSHQKSEPEVGMPAELQHSKASLWNVGQKRKTLKKAKINKMLCSFS